MSSTTSSTSQFLEGLNQLWVKSLQANLRLAQNSAEALRLLGSQPRAMEQAKPLMAEAVNQYARAGLQQAGQWLDFQLALSNELVARLGGSRMASEPAKSSTPAPAIVDLLLKIAPGAEGETGFLVENNRGQRLAARLVASPLTAVGTATQLDATLRLEPDSLALQPGEKVRISVKLAVPPTAAPGVYAGTIRLSGYPDIECRLTVEVSKADEAAIPTPPDTNEEKPASGKTKAKASRRRPRAQRS